MRHECGHDDRRQQQSVAIGSSPSYCLRGDQTAGTRLVFHYDGLTSFLGDGLRNDPSQHVECAPWRKADDDAQALSSLHLDLRAKQEKSEQKMFHEVTLG